MFSTVMSIQALNAVGAQHAMLQLDLKSLLVNTGWKHPVDKHSIDAYMIIYR